MRVHARPGRPGRAAGRLRVAASQCPFRDSRERWPPACRAQAASPASRACWETRLNTYYPPTYVHLVQARLNACPPPAPACIVLPRAAPRRAAARTPRTGYCGRRRRSDRPFRTGFIRWLEEEEILPRAPVFHEFLESIYFQTLKSLFGRRVRSWLRTNAGGAPNTCKSNGVERSLLFST